MAKSKNKPLKQYKVPREKFLVVVDAWGFGGDFTQSDFNNVSAWFEIMLEETYPKTRVSSIYYQRTHRNLIVELPSVVQDINQYLGAHFYSRFLTHDVDAHRQMIIYEYKYANFGDPGERNWSVGYPSYTSIPPDIPIRRPFPLLPFPPPRPASDIPYAVQVPADVLAANERRHVLQAFKVAEATPAPPCSTSTCDPRTSFETSQPCDDETTPDRSVPLTPLMSEASGSSSDFRSNRAEIPLVRDNGRSSAMDGMFTPYVAPSHLTSHLKESIPHHLPSAALGDTVTKRDPYEEDEESRNVLRFPSSVKAEEAEDFLGSFLPIVKREEEKPTIKPEDEDDYQHSVELLAALSTLPPQLLDVHKEVAEEEEELKPRVKPEPVEQEIGDYHPSDELLAALAELPSGLRPEHVQVKREHDPPPANYFDERKSPPRVKDEPMEGVLPSVGHRSAIPQLSDSKNRFASQSHVQVKSEPIDDRRRLQHIPPLNRSLRPQVDYDASRDPRLKRLDVQRKNSGDKRDSGHLSQPHVHDSKRIKREYLED
ncbi:hypothetical protein M413DRAFT_445622 [Hebeloma cylindrosporum]|uniref:Uncharacterized protein n=1 Tax=Hebeloma cylindrosporum TaxID=76867 RepID=A0A0C2YID1_HEBCY|nr:hypothetical protein M413DRAFT_445622 [Hebeloma cylindrosporum h7]